MKRLLTALILGTLIPGTAMAADLSTDKQKFSYALGTQIGRNVSEQGVELDADAFAAGVRDLLKGDNLQLSNEQMQLAAERYQQELKTRRDAAGTENSAAGSAFREKNKQATGVKELDNGIQYKVIEAGDGAKPSVEDTVTVHYRGTDIDGEQFDSSYDRGEPATFQLNKVIKGWQEILPMMQEGGTWHVVIPPKLAYGERGAGAAIGPNETLVFDIELIEIKATD
ncbi:MAG: FKBP-type peptidyl-prolyl cis-trans isomerase [Gammaproteobacteria bacterium]|nr:FKBP-type peptidyl-prolyl cis-trans isomerase [Gammaproteobacteria bacterium]